MGKVTKELENAIQVVTDLALYYQLHDKRNMAKFALNARRELEAAKHIERITKG